MRDHIINYWSPPVEFHTYQRMSFTKQGSLKHDIIQEIMHRAGLTYCKAEEFKEYYIKDADSGMAGKVDFILDFDKIKAVGHSKGKQKYVTPKGVKWICSDIKETGTRRYDEWIIADLMPEEYKSQISLYSHFLNKAGILPFDRETMFWVLCRDDPNKYKTLFYKPELKHVSNALETASLFWEHIQNRTLPGEQVPGWEGFIEETIEEQEGRKWNLLSGIHVTEQLLLDFNEGKEKTMPEDKCDDKDCCNDDPCTKDKDKPASDCCSGDKTCG